MAHLSGHGKLLLQRLYQQREMDFLCDITIMVKDVEFRAHRNILAAFSKYFYSQAEKGVEVITLDPDKVSRYSLEKLLEFIYTGQMNLSSTRKEAVRRAAVFLGMPEATKYPEEFPHCSEPSETSEADKEGLSPRSACSDGSPSSPVPLSIISIGGDWKAEEGDSRVQDPDFQDEDFEIVGKSDEEYMPQVQSFGTARRGRRPKNFTCKQEQPNVADSTPKIQSSRGRGRPRGSGRGRGRGRGASKSQDLSLGDSDTSLKDFGDTSADWSPSQGEESLPKKPRLSFGRRRKGRGRGRGRGRRVKEVEFEEEDEDDESVEGVLEDEVEEGEIRDRDPSDLSDLTLSCSECNKLFKDVSSLRRHEKIHKGLKPFSCIFCSKTFRQATQLKTHLRIHTGEKPFNCSSCDKCFAQKCQLVAHRRMHHGEEKPYTCERCGFKFATSSNYKIHIRLHSGEKPYVCDICGQAFAQSSTLTYHKRRHTGEKPYQCDLCGMSFSVSSSLIAHARKHTGETPYKCSQPKCDAKFVTSSELKKHMRRLHPDGNSGVQCLLCGNRFASVKNMIKHQEKAHADEVRQHKERARAVVLLASSHPVAFVQSKLSQENKGLASVPEGEPPNPEPATPNPKAPAPAAASSSDATDTSIIQELKPEPSALPLSTAEQVTFDQEQTINSDTLHALVEQLRPPPSPAQSLEQIVIIRTVDTADSNPPQQ
ncbi:myoneurin isoform X2 [Oryzias melastigma]|nr:myoneurin isoform X2 [Oryzias melastigma]XP_024137888.1 myoneurin isoform X2 [Oryzias melastigma]XP_024137889.1 myoneurin isoform X2 [Oryzias melastigma]XP_024137890.1 myoneurin isoform X2 [Oryzias melastigma]XP_024137891.1 myoneurin isoform X2 [Oryzias melastigma]